MDVTAFSNTVNVVQAAFNVVQMLNLTAWRYPPPCTLTNGTTYDFIIVGGGTAGSVLANRLSTNSRITVLLIETGGYPPIEADDFPGLSSTIPGSMYDYNYFGQNDHCTAQNLQHRSISITAGKMLGGSGSLQHSLYVRGFSQDYDQWAELLQDEFWNYNNTLPYFKKIEKITNKDLRTSPYYQNYFGTSGMLDLTRESNPSNNKYLAAFNELGHRIQNVATKLGYAETLFNIGNGVRHSTSLRYLGLANSRPNLCMLLFTTATKILIKDNIAIGVQVTSNNVTYVFYAQKEVVVSAGAINSPRLLMLSGIGPKSHLKSLGIKIVVDLPVGQNFQDHSTAVIGYQMEKSSRAAIPLNPHAFSLPLFLGLVALDGKQVYPDYMSINIEVQHDSSAILNLCTNMFKYSNDICQKLFDANKSRTLLFVIISLLMPKSTGQILLASADPSHRPLVYPGMFSNKSDLKLLAKSLEDYHNVFYTTYFRSVNASMVNLNLCSNTKTIKEFWKCYTLKMSNTLWHYCGTCAMGSVLDNRMRVKGVGRLRVVDASAMPRLIRGKIFAPVAMLAERAADLILSTWHIHV